MKILALMIVKNEDDIIGHALEAAARWADYIVVLDNNSTDNTVDIIKTACAAHKNIIFWGRYEGPFHDWLRSLIYNDYKHLITPDDWVCRLDADEFYIDDPKQFLSELPPEADMVYSASFQYYFTEKDAEADNSHLPAPQRMKYYLCNHSEERFCKIRKNTFWPVTRNWPMGIINISQRRIRLKHFQYRSAEQMQKRFAVRESVNLSTANTNLFLHEFNNNKVFESRHLVADNGVYEYDESSLPSVNTMKEGGKFKALLINKLFGISKIRQAIHPLSNTRKI